jgi:hypothetical protein
MLIFSWLDPAPIRNGSDLQHCLALYYLDPVNPRMLDLNPVH